MSSDLTILILTPFMFLCAYLIWIWGVVCKICQILPYYHLLLVFFLFPISKNAELQWFLLCIVTILGKWPQYFHLRSCVCGFEEIKSYHLGVPSKLVFYKVLDSFLMVDTGSSYNRMMSSLRILYCVEGVPFFWQQIISLFEIFLSWFPLTWFSMRPLGQVPLLYYLPLLHWRTWAKKGPNDAGWSHGVQGHLESIWWWLDELLIDVMAYNKGIVCLFFFPHFLVS